MAEHGDDDYDTTSSTSFSALLNSLRSHLAEQEKIFEEKKFASLGTTDSTATQGEDNDDVNRAPSFSELSVTIPAKSPVRNTAQASNHSPVNLQSSANFGTSSRLAAHGTTPRGSISPLPPPPGVASSADNATVSAVATSFLGVEAEQDRERLRSELRSKEVKIKELENALTASNKKRKRNVQSPPPPPQNTPMNTPKASTEDLVEKLRRQIAEEKVKMEEVS